MKRIAGFLLIIPLVIGVSSYETYAASANELVVGLINSVKSLKLDKGIQKSFLSKLEGAQEVLQSGNAGQYKSAGNKLNAFKNQVRAQTGKRLTTSQAVALIAQADQIIGLVTNTKVQSVGTSGGTVQVTDPTSPITGSSVSFPPNAVPSETLITVVPEPTPPKLVTNVTAAGPAITFGPEDTSFSSPVTIGVPFDAAFPVGNIKLYTFDELAETWKEVPGSYSNAMSHIIYGVVNHFSTFQAGVDSGDPGAPYFEVAVARSTRSAPTPSNPSGPVWLELVAQVVDPNGKIPETIVALTVNGPNNFSYSFSLADVLFHIPRNAFMYSPPLVPGVPASGRYMFEVTDIESKVSSAYMDVEVNPIPCVEKSTLSPQDGEVVSTTPTLGWEPISAPTTIYYRWRIQDSSRTTIYDSSRSTDTSRTIPPGVLQPNSTYYWRAEATDSQFASEASNRSMSSYVKIYTADEGYPYFNWVAVWNDSTRDGDGLQLTAYVGHPNPNGTVRDTIRSVTVTGPDGFSTSLQPEFDVPTNDYLYVKWIPGRPASGLYVFEVEDIDGKKSVAYHGLVVNPIPPVDKNSFVPSDGETVSVTPDLSWARIPVSRPGSYRVALRDAAGTIIYYSNLNGGNGVTIPNGILEAGSTYSWRVEAFDKWSLPEANNRSVSEWATFYIPITLNTMVFHDKSAFLSATGPNAIATFEDVPVGTLSPFTSNGVFFPRTLEVLDNLVGWPHSLWFPGTGSPSKFVIHEPLGPEQFLAVFPNDVTAAGFDCQCFACDTPPNQSIMNWKLLTGDGSVVASGSEIFDFTWGDAGHTRFFGILSNQPFRSLDVARTDVVPNSYFNWLVDDVRSW